MDPCMEGINKGGLGIQLWKLKTREGWGSNYGRYNYNIFEKMEGDLNCAKHKPRVDETTIRVRHLNQSASLIKQSHQLRS